MHVSAVVGYRLPAQLHRRAAPLVLEMVLAILLRLFYHSVCALSFGPSFYHSVCRESRDGPKHHTKRDGSIVYYIPWH